MSIHTLNPLRRAQCRPGGRPLVSGLMTLGVWLAMTWGLTAASLPSEWKNVQSFRTDKTGLLQVEIPLETLDACRPNLEDLRLYDEQGKEVPYLSEQPRQTVRQVRSAKNFQVELTATATRIRFEPASSQPLLGLTLETPAREFLKAVTLRTSTNGRSWTTARQGYPLFRQFSGASRLFMPLSSNAIPYYELLLDDRRTAPIPVTGIQLYEAEPEPVREVPVSLKIIEREEGLGETRLTVHAPGAHLTLASLTLETPDVLFTRPVSLYLRQLRGQEIEERVLYQATVFRVALDPQTSVSNAFLASDVTLPVKEFVLKIENGDSPPLQITGLSATRRPVDLLFLATQAGRYHLLSGNAHCPSPRYDLASRRAQLTPTMVQPTETQPLQANPAYQAVDLVPAVALGSALDLSAWQYRKRVSIAQAGAGQVELDPELLAHSQGFQDLRLMAGDRQLPFILERTSLTRALTPQINNVDDAKRPKVSRWELIFAQAGLPLTKLTLATEAAYFRRGVLLYEEVPDDRGAPHNRPLQQTTWTKTLEQKSGSLTLELHGLMTDRLFLEIDNGDNPPLAIRNLQAWYPVTRLLFKSPPGISPLYLYYGNKQVNPPQYDLELVAGQLLAAEKLRCVLDPEQRLRGGGWFEEGLPKGQATLLFWLVLIGVVAGLLCLIARLLPKPGPP